MIRLYIIIVLIVFAENLFAQNVQDSVKPAVVDSSVIKTQNVSEKDSLNGPVIHHDSIISKPVLDSAWKTKINPYLGKSFNEIVYKANPFFAFEAPAFIVNSDVRIFKGKELLFYSLVALLLLFAFLRSLFPKYFNDLFRLFFRRTLKQRQVTEQLSQTPLPSLILNSFFMATAGIYLGFILQHYSLANQVNFWLLCLYSAGGLAAIYLIKFLSLKFTGWVLNLSAATDSYIFIVFIINKVIGIFLLPFLILLAFTQGDLYQVSLTLSWLGLACLFTYRFVLSYSALYNQIKIKPLHFIIYLLAFEIVPLLLIYKLLLYFLF